LKEQLLGKLIQVQHHREAIENSPDRIVFLKIQSAAAVAGR
jgi:hypothetical protein